MTANRRSVLTALASASVTGSLALRSSPDLGATAGGSAPIEPIFSYPMVGVPDDVHERTVRDILERAAPGTAVRLTTFTFTRRHLATACLDAADRGVDLRVLIDEYAAGADATRLLRERLGDRVSIVTDGAIGRNNNHNKFLLAEELTTGESNVVWQSTSNFTRKQLYRHNSSVVFREDDSLYDVYLDYWDDLAAGDTDLDYNRTEETDAATVYFSPRSDFDTHLEPLEAVVPGPDATVRFANSIWSPNRLAVVDRVAELVEQGARVEVILNGPESDVGPKLRAAGASVLEYPRFTLSDAVDPGIPPNVHSKNMLIDAPVDVGGETERKRLVFTGSQNLSGPGLSANDDVLLRIEDDDVYCEFLADWKLVREQGARLSDGGIPALTRPRPERVLEDVDCTL